MNITEQSITNLVSHQYSNAHPLEENYMNSPRPFHTLAYVLTGSFQCITASYEITAKQGDILLIPYKMKYILRWLEPNTSFCGCHFNFPDYSEPFGNKDFFLQKFSGFQERLSDFKYICDNIGDNNCLFGVLSTFYKLLNDLYPYMAYKKELHIDERIRKAVEYINTNYRSNITIDELAALCNLSPSHFYSCFKKEVKMTAIDYKNSICVKQSCLLLSDNNMSIEEISAECGFQSAEYFRRVFKTHMKMSPREYRKNIRSTL